MDNEIDQQITAQRAFTYVNNLQLDNNLTNEYSNLTNTLVFNFHQFYTCKPLKELNLEIRSNKIARFCCAFHKINLAVRQVDETIYEILTTINDSCAKVRK